MPHTDTTTQGDDKGTPEHFSMNFFLVICLLGILTQRLIPSESEKLLGVLHLQSVYQTSLENSSEATKWLLVPARCLFKWLNH
jgi:hypothetical protein